MSMGLHGFEENPQQLKTNKLLERIICNAYTNQHKLVCFSIVIFFCSFSFLPSTPKKKKQAKNTMLPETNENDQSKEKTSVFLFFFCSRWCCAKQNV